MQIHLLNTSEMGTILCLRQAWDTGHGTGHGTLDTGYIWTHMETFGHMWTHVHTYGYIWGPEGQALAQTGGGPKWARVLGQGPMGPTLPQVLGQGLALGPPYVSMCVHSCPYVYMCVHIC